MVPLNESGTIAAPANCLPAYECQFSIANGLNSYLFDFSTLCRAAGYSVRQWEGAWCAHRPSSFTAVLQTSDDSGHQYDFNICGTSPSKCLPTWRNSYQFGAAVQVRR